MTATIPTRIDRDLFDAAKAAGAMQSRSATQQMAHWARIGRAFEDSRLVSHRDVVAVLSGQASYDNLNTAEQAVVRATWDEQDTATISDLNFAAEFAAAGKGYAEADAAGNLVDHPSPGRDAGAGA